MARLRIDPRGRNPYTENLMGMIQQMALYDWKQKQTQGVAQQNLKALGLDAGISGADTDGRAYVSGVDLKTGIPSVKFRSPEEIKGRRFQKDITGFKEAERAIGGAATGGEAGPTPTYLKARSTYEKGRPKFAGKQFVQDVKGRYKEVAPQPVYDPETGEIQFTVPKGARKGKAAKATKKELASDIDVIFSDPKLTEEQKIAISSSIVQRSGFDISEFPKLSKEKRPSLIQRVKKWLP